MTESDAEPGGPGPPAPGPDSPRPVGSWLLPVLGGSWLMLTLGVPAGFYLLGAFAYGAVRAVCEMTGGPCHFHRLPVSIEGAALGGSAIAVLLVIIVVPHRGRLRWLRGGLLAPLVVLSLNAAALLVSTLTR